jgi:2-pyrone-4,6-dicarboxylate lactonase
MSRVTDDNESVAPDTRGIRNATVPSCAPPIAATKRPGWRPPSGACDAHCHVFGPSARFPFHASRKYTPPDAPVEALMALHKVLGLSRAVLVQATCHGTDNRAMVDALERSGDRYRGVAMIGDRDGAATYEALHEKGVRGVRFSFARHISGAPDFEAVRRAATIAAPLGWHLDLYFEAEDLIEYAGRLPELGVPIVIDHMARIKTAGSLAQPAFQILLALLRNEDIWVKISCAERLSSTGQPYTDVVPFAQAVIEAAPDRVLWGTDWPHPNVPAETMPNDGDLLDLLALYALDEAVRDRILVDNPARLYGFGPLVEPSGNDLAPGIDSGI